MVQRLRKFLAKPVAANSLWLMADRVGRMGVNFLLTVWIARHVGPESFGHLQLAISLIAVMAFSSTLGLDQIAIREFATRPDEQGRLLGTIMALRLVSGLTGYAALMAFLFAARPYEDETLHLAAILGIGLLFQAADSIDWWFLSRTRSRVSVQARTLAFCCSALWRIIAVLTHAPLMVIGVATLIELVVAAPLMLFVLKRFGGLEQPLRADPALARQLLKLAVPMCLNAIAVILYMKLDQLLVGRFLGAGGAGLYAAAARLSEVWYMIPTTIVASAAASLAQARQRDRLDYDARMRRLFRFLAMVSIGLAIPVSLLAEAIITTLYGVRYAPAADVLRLHIFTAIFVYAGTLQGQWIINEGLTRLMLPRMLAAAAVSIGLNLLLLPRLGLIGAPLALLGGQVVAVILFPLFSPGLRPLLRLQLGAMRLRLAS